MIFIHRRVHPSPRTIALRLPWRRRRRDSRQRGRHDGRFVGWRSFLRQTPPRTDSRFDVCQSEEESKAGSLVFAVFFFFFFFSGTIRVGEAMWRMRRAVKCDTWLETEIRNRAVWKFFSVSATNLNRAVYGALSKKSCWLEVGFIIYVFGVLKAFCWFEPQVSSLYHKEYLDQDFYLYLTYIIKTPHCLHRVSVATFSFGRDHFELRRKSIHFNFLKYPDVKRHYLGGVHSSPACVLSSFFSMCRWRL